MGKSAKLKKARQSGDESSSQGVAKKSAAKKSVAKSRNQSQRRSRNLPEGMTQARYDKLVAESKAPFKGLRKFAYASFGASGAIGGFVFFTKILAGRDLAQSVPNLALQLGVVALMVFLFRWEDREKKED